MQRISVGFVPDGAVSGSDLLAEIGPTLQVDIGFDPRFDHSIGGVPKPGVTDMPALIDTGATSSCIDIQVATRLALPVVDRRVTAGITGKFMTEMCMAQVHVPSLNYTIYGQFAVVRLQEGGIRQPVLIGRTFLQDFHMAYDGRTGRVTLEID